MQVINTLDLEAVSGGDIECTVGTDGVNCTGTAEEWGDVIFGAYDTLVDWTSDAFMWIDDTWSSFWY